MSQLAVPPRRELRLRRGSSAPTPPLVVDDRAPGDGTQAETAPGPRESRVVVGTPQAVVE